MLTASLSAGKPGAVITGESEKARERLHRPPSTGSPASGS